MIKQIIYTIFVILILIVGNIGRDYSNSVTLDTENTASGKELLKQLKGEYNNYYSNLFEITESKDRITIFFRRRIRYKEDEGNNIFLQMKNVAETAAEYARSDPKWCNKRKVNVQRYTGQGLPPYVEIDFDIKTGKIVEYNISETWDISSEQFTDLNGIEVLKCPKLDMDCIPRSEDLTQLTIKKIGNNDLSQFCNAPNLERLNFDCPVETDFSTLKECRSLKRLTACYIIGMNEDPGINDINYKSLEALDGLERLVLVFPDRYIMGYPELIEQIESELREALPECEVVIP